MTLYDLHVLGGLRAMDESIFDLEPLAEPSWRWPHLAVWFAIAVLLGVVVYLAQ